MEEKDAQKWEGRRKITKKRKINTENTFSVLQEEDTESLWEKEEPPKIVKIVKIDKDEKNICKGKGRGKIRKVHNKRKGESETGPKPGLLKNYSNEEIQNKNWAPLRCKSAKCHNKRYKYKTKE